ncbi:hemerythrin domain-containing protein [Pseudonocardia petroleophila]|uniref:Hemerythrin domain-containing protein n=1 Tax=Pseudonocardia petroleophila TaxID=37331 RepID=A0A7G7MQZ3_9PSEU|nr:hemerythrin domain-containing protein [Pseudonocardia petroleophila]QNG55204.1 hemerythrin domain-containing protein [Pseudonocardia petroleophila]
MTTTRTAPNLVGMRLAHRMIVTDLLRLTQVARGISERSVACSDRRAFAIGDWVRSLCVEIRHHHLVEDGTAWPLVDRFAGAYVDLGVLSADHRAMDPMLERLRVAVAALEEAPPAERGVVGRALTAALTTLRDHVVEHVEAEEAEVFPAVERHVPAAEWARVEKAAGRGGAGLAFMLPRFLAVAVDDEHRTVFGPAGRAERALMAVLAWVLVPLHRRRERLVFG